MSDVAVLTGLLERTASAAHRRLCAVECQADDLSARVTALEVAAAVPGPCGVSWERAEPEAAVAASEAVCGKCEWNGEGWCRFYKAPLAGVVGCRVHPERQTTEVAQQPPHAPEAACLPDGWVEDSEGIRDHLDRTRAWRQASGHVRIGGLSLTLAELEAILSWARRTART